MRAFLTRAPSKDLANLPLRNFTLFSVSAGVGVAIPYPAITLHAIKHYRGDPQVGVPALYMQLDLAPEGGDGDDDFETVELTLLLPPSPHNVELSGSGDDVTGTAARERESSTLAATRVLFDAVATCSNLHPDPSADSDEDEGEDNDRFRHRKLPSNKGGAFNGFVLHEDSVHNRNGHDDAATFDYDEAEESEGLDPGIVIPGRSDGGLPPPFPGSGGWITAENVDQFLDADGNWIGWSGSGGNEEDEEKDDGAGGEEPTNGAEPTDGETAVSDGKRPGDDSTEASEVKRARVGPS